MNPVKAVIQTSPTLHLCAQQKNQRQPPPPLFTTFCHLKMYKKGGTKKIVAYY